MDRILLTHSLLSSWLYALKGNPYEDATTERDPMSEFMATLRRDPTPTTEAMQRGIDFENLVTDIVVGRGDRSNKWYDAANIVAADVRGGLLQYRAKKPIEVQGVPLLLYGRLDCLKAGNVIDIKFSGSYDRGKYITSTQHPVPRLASRGRPSAALLREVENAMNGRLKEWAFSRTGESILVLTTRESCKQLWGQLGGGEITFSIKKRATPRSLNANNYAWSLIEKLATAIKSDKDTVYEEMLRRYGTGESYTDEAGNECKVLFSLREGIPPSLVARHYAEVGVGYIDGKKFIHYRAIKGTSEYSTKEMSVFLDGIVSECREVGIQTDTPEMIARYKEAWNK